MTSLSHGSKLPVNAACWKVPKCQKASNGYIMSIFRRNGNSQIQISLSLLHQNTKTISHTFSIADTAAAICCNPLPSQQQMGYPLYLHQHVLQQPQPRQKQGPSPNPETGGEHHHHPSHQTGEELLQHPI